MSYKQRKANQDWHYLQNQFLNKAKLNRSLALTLITHHRNNIQGLESNPKLKDIAKDFEPLYNTFNKAYQQWRYHAARGIVRRKATEEIRDKIMSTYARQWSIAVQYHCRETPKDYQLYFPKKLRPLQNGSHLSRLIYLGFLKFKLEGKEQFKEVYTSVAAAHQEYEEKRDNQLSMKISTKKYALQLDKATHDITWQMYRNLGSLMAYYGEDTGAILNYFNVTLIRSKTTKKKKEEDLTLEDLGLTEEEVKREMDS